MYKNEKIHPTDFFKGKSVLITGACGTIGRNLTKHILQFKVKKLRLLDVDDTNLTEMRDEFDKETNRDDLRFLIGDIRDQKRLIRAFEDIDYVFHCAALKHVAIGEYNPQEVIRTNIIGTENVIEAALRNNVKKVIYTSSDKAVNPVNTMGASKLLGEKLIVAANYIKGLKQTKFSAVRFGNVLGSRGSIIPRFKKRVEKGLDLVVTDPNMTRFMMPIQDAVKLTIRAMTISLGGEIFVLKMPSLILGDLVELFLEYAWLKYGINLKVITMGLFPGEKIYEELMTEEEVTRAIETRDMYLILPHIKELHNLFPQYIFESKGNTKTKEYNSQFKSPLTKTELSKILEKFEVFEKS